MDGRAWSPELYAVGRSCGIDIRLDVLRSRRDGVLVSVLGHRDIATDVDVNAPDLRVEFDALE